MHIRIPQSDLSVIINNCGNVIEANSSHEMLSHFLIDASPDGTLTIIATDLDISMIEKTKADVITPGKITVDANVLRNIVQKCNTFSTIELKLDAEKNRINLKSDSSVFNIATLPPQNYPEIKNHIFDCEFSLPFNKFKHMLDLTSFAISTEETRYHLNGVYLHCKNQGELRLVATDGHRLTKSQCYLKDLPLKLPGVIISGKTVDIIQNLAKSTADDSVLTINLSDTLIKFSVNNVVIFARLIDGVFPDYERVIPIKDKCINVNLDQVNTIVGRVTTLGFEKIKGVKVFFDPDKMRFAYEDKLVGSSNDEISITYDGEPFQIGFNSKYLIDAAKNLKYGDEAEMWVQNENSAIVIKHRSDDDSMCVIMPMRI